jgi:hypothetical protein
MGKLFNSRSLMLFPSEVSLLIRKLDDTNDLKGRNKDVARFQILYWEHIPLGVKATDVNGTVRENLPARFQKAVENASLHAGHSSAAAYTSMFKWGKEREQEGTAAEVAANVAKELDETWTEENALGLFDQYNK